MSYSHYISLAFIKGPYSQLFFFFLDVSSAVAAAPAGTGSQPQTISSSWPNFPSGDQSGAGVGTPSLLLAKVFISEMEQATEK